MKALAIAALLGGTAASAPYDRLFDTSSTFRLACSRQHQDVRYAPACTPSTCDPDGELTCTVMEAKPRGGAEVSRMDCRRVDAKGTARSWTQWLARTPAGMWELDHEPTARDVAVALRRRPLVTARPIVGVIKPKRDPDGEDDRLTGVALDRDRWCLDTEVGKSNPSWGRWCLSPAGGVVGTLHTHAESVIAERCGDPL